MYAVSERWERTIKNSHSAIARVDAIRGDEVTPLAVRSGRILVSYDDPTRWALDCEVIDEENRVFEAMRGIIDPYITEFVAWAGVVHPDGTQELCECGHYFSKDLEITEMGGGPVWRINTFDASIRLQGELAMPYYIASGVDPTSVVPPFLHSGFARANIIPTPTNFSTPTLVIRESSIRWTEGRKLVGSCGLDLTMSRTGRGIMEPRRLEAAGNAPAWTFDENDLADFNNISRKSVIDDKPNVVQVVATHPAVTNVVGIAADEDPNSKTYRYGDYGEVIKVIRTELVTNEDQANQMAKWMLSKLLGPQEELSLYALSNPALDVGDVVEITRERMGLDKDRLLVARIELPLTVTEWMKVTLRRSVFTNEEALPL